MRKFAILGLGALALGLTAFPASAQQNRKSGDLPGPIDNVQDLQDTGRMLFKLADENNDGQISQKEAVDAGNLLVGGFFFRADQNGDGILSKDEARQAREAFMSSKPWLRYVVETARTAKGQEGGAGAGGANAAGAGGARSGNAGNRNLLANVAGAFDTNNDGQLQASELRQAVTTAVQGAFATADTNRDGQLSQTELNAAVAGVARQVAQASFQQADTDGNGQISQAEFEKAIVEPARVAFKVMDLNHDGQISMQEAQTARQVLLTKVRSLNMPEAQNSPRNAANSALGNQTQPAASGSNSSGTPAAPPSNPR